MCEKFETISMKYNDFLNKDSYCWEGPWKLYKWNPGYSRKKQTCLVANPNYVFSTTNTESFICGKFQAISYDNSNIQKFKHIKESGLS